MPGGNDEILFAWAHLSDLHVGRGDAAGRRLVLAEIARDMGGAEARGCPKVDALFVTGDVAWSGAAGEYGEATTQLARIAEAGRVAPGSVYVVPGNHDVDRSASGDRDAARLVQNLRAGLSSLDESIQLDRALLAKTQHAYLAFAEALTPRCANLFWTQAIRARGGLPIRLVGLNTALLAHDDADRGKLQLGNAQLAAALLGADAGELIVVLSHHPFRDGWLLDETNVDRWITNHAHLHLFGHVKDAASEEALSGAGGRFVRIAAGAAHVEVGDHGYSIGAIVRREDGALAVRVWPRRWSDRNKRFRDDVGGVPEGQRFAEHALRDPGGEARRPDAEARGRNKAQTIFEGAGGVPVSAVPHFLGRDEAMRDLREALRQDKAVCVVATGLGGIGKTSLVRQLVAEHGAEMFPDGSVWLDAMNLDADVARACKRFGHEGQRAPTLVDGARFLAQVLHEQRVLVVIDNVWADHVDVAALPVVGGKARMVITSRVVALHESLGQPAQQLVLGRWSWEACQAYLREVVPSLASASDRDMDALAEFVGRLPLAVRLLARLLMRANASPKRLLDRLKQEPLGTLDKVATGVDRGVAATFKASYEALDDTQRRVLLALAACARVTAHDTVTRITAVTSPAYEEEAPRSAAEPWIGGVAGLDGDQVGEVLADLAERSLVECVDREAGLWTLHDVVRLFVSAQEGARQAEAAHLAFAEQHVEAHQEPLDWEAMEAGMEEVLAAVDRLLDAGDASRAVRLVGRARVHMVRRGRYAELLARYEQLAARLPEGSEELAVVLGNAGVCYRTLGAIQKSIEHHQRALAIDENLGRLEGQAADLGNLGNCYKEQGDVPKAIEHHQRALAIDEKLGRLEGQAIDLGNLGLCYREQGDVPKCIEHLQRALAINEKLGRLEGQAANLHNLGICYREQGDVPKAIEHHQRALAIDEKLGRLEGQAIALYNLGACHHDQGDHFRALDHFQRALALYRRVGLPDHHPRVRNTLAALALLRPLTPAS